MTRRFWLETLGCPKNEVDSAKLTGTLVADGMEQAPSPEDADLVVVNTCAFVEEAREESIDTILTLGERRRAGAELVVTGCLAQRYGAELAEAIPEADAVVGFGVPVTIGAKPSLPSFDLLNLPRPASPVPWAYVKIAEGCDRACGYCAIPSFRGPQRSRTVDDVLAEVDTLEAAEIVLVAQDLAAFGRDQGVGERRIVELVGAVSQRVPWVRLLYLYPSDLSDELIDAICATGVPYFDLSLQHVSRPLLRRMRRWGDGERFTATMEAIRRREPGAAFRTNFIVGYPGETEEDHDALVEFVRSARLDWCGFFAWSPEDGTHAIGLDGRVDDALVAERLAELRDIQDVVTEQRRDELIGREVQVLVDEPGVGRTYREAPEIDGIVTVPDGLAVGGFHRVRVVAASGPDLIARPDPPPGSGPVQGPEPERGADPVGERA